MDADGLSLDQLEQVDCTWEVLPLHLQSLIWFKTYEWLCKFSLVQERWLPCHRWLFLSWRSWTNATSHAQDRRRNEFRRTSKEHIHNRWISNKGEKASFNFHRLLLTPVIHSIGTRRAFPVIIVVLLKPCVGNGMNSVVAPFFFQITVNVKPLNKQ